MFGLWLLASLRSPAEKDGFATQEFGRLPVLLGGRIQPLDSVAINSLLSMHGARTVRLEDGGKLSASQWFLEVMMRPEQANQRKIFRVENLELRALLNAREGRLGQVSFQDLQPQLDKLESQARQIAQNKSEAQTRSPYEKDLMHLYESLLLYHRVRNSLRPDQAADFAPPEMAKDFSKELEHFQKAIAPGMAAMRQGMIGEELKSDEEKNAAALLSKYFGRYENLDQIAYPLLVPPLDPAHARDDWRNVGKSLTDALHDGQVHPAIFAFAAMADAYRVSRPSDFNRAVSDYRLWLETKKFDTELKKGIQESFFNRVEPFYKSMIIYVVALLFGCAFWLNSPDWVRRSGYFLLALAFIVHTFGLGFRMYLEGRPPVTNLYSSAIFVGWGAVLLCLFLERVHRGGIGIVVGATVGFVTLIIAHHLSLSGDTMEMLRAVLDTNLWLATHVVTITIGYSAMFVAGFLAVVYILRGVFTRGLTDATAKALSRMVYGIVCFSTLFSFVGTILGGIWADQSWGRFWGWDPKENGALLIVLWCAAILHARWGGLIKDRGLMVMALCGNIVTSFSWFGVNMLGVGLHSYGFMDQAFRWLLGFVLSQVAFIALALLPERYWMSFRGVSRSHGPPVDPGLGAQKPASAAT